MIGSSFCCIYFSWISLTETCRYSVLNVVGKGVFSSVVRALEQSKDTTREVAIKVIRNNDVMLKAAQKEISILRKLEEDDNHKHGRRHCVQFLRYVYIFIYLLYWMRVIFLH